MSYITHGELEVFQERIEYLTKKYIPLQRALARVNLMTCTPNNYDGITHPFLTYLIKLPSHNMTCKLGLNTKLSLYRKSLSEISMQVTIQIDQINNLKEIVKINCDGIRFGSEFCMWKIPSQEVLKKVHEITTKIQKEFTYMTTKVSSYLTSSQDT